MMLMVVVGIHIVYTCTSMWARFLPVHRLPRGKTMKTGKCGSGKLGFTFVQYGAISP